MKYILVFFSIITFLFTSDAYSSDALVIEVNTGSTQKTQTIKQLQENIKTLTEEKSDLKTRWESFRQENGKIFDFLTTPLDTDSQKQIEDILTAYYSTVNALETQIETTARNLENADALKEEIIRAKLELYKALVPYINKAKLSDYLNYIKGNIEIEKDDNKLNEEIYRKKGIIDQKVEVIRGKIEENRKVLETKIEDAVNKKLEEKIEKILSNQKFQALPSESQIKVFESTLEKITHKKEVLMQIETRTTIVEKKIEIYQIVEGKLEFVISTLSE